MTPTRTSRARALLPAAGWGAVAGLAGVAAMTAAETLEQRVTGRPNSYVPARALLTLLGGHPGDTARPAGWNHAMHWGTGAAVGALRGVWSAVGLRGPRASLAHTAVRLATDQTIENATGVGAPPHNLAGARAGGRRRIQGRLLARHRDRRRPARAAATAVPPRPAQPLSRLPSSRSGSARGGPLRQLDGVSARSARATRRSRAGMQVTGRKGRLSATSGRLEWG